MRYLAELATLYPALVASDLSLLAAQLRTEYKRARQLGGDVLALTAERVQAMSQAELEQAIEGLRTQASALAT